MYLRTVKTSPLNTHLTHISCVSKTKAVSLYQQKRNKPLKLEVMTTQELKNKVIARLVKNGNNENEVEKMVSLHFEYASKNYSTVKTISECIRTIY